KSPRVRTKKSILALQKVHLGASKSPPWHILLVMVSFGWWCMLWKIRTENRSALRDVQASEGGKQPLGKVCSQVNKHSKKINAPNSSELDEPSSSRIGFAPNMMVKVRPFPTRSTNRAAIEYVNGPYRLTITARAPGELPAGKIPRLILIWLAREIQRDGEDVDSVTRTVYAGASFKGFLDRLGMPYKGTARTKVMEQMERLASAAFRYLDLSEEMGDRHKGENFFVADAYALTFGSRAVQDESLFPNFITLSWQMWKMLTDYPIPVDLNMVAKMGKSALALDVYTWATYRVNEMKQPLHLTWQQLYEQFSAGEIAELKKFRQRFRGAVADVVRVYPDLHIDVSSSKQVVLYPSVPSILTREMKAKPLSGRVTAPKVSSKARGDTWVTVSTEYGRGRVFGSLEAFTTVQAQQHLSGVVPLGRACPVCAFDARNEEFHGSLAGGR
ncbi:MAG: hypothetical protein L0K89_01425, partial [Bifidobacterium crudilactis]|nr:hypothetical protein [Bifidobacterium crudilactis]